MKNCNVTVSKKQGNQKLICLKKLFKHKNYISICDDPLKWGQYYEYKACILVLSPNRMSFTLVLMRNSHSLLSLTSPCSHPLLPPPYYSPCLTLTVIRFGHLLLEPTPTCLPCRSHPLQLHIFLYSLYISALVFFLCHCLHAASVSRLIPCSVLDRASDSSVLMNLGVLLAGLEHIPSLNMWSAFNLLCSLLQLFPFVYSTVLVGFHKTFF